MALDRIGGYQWGSPGEGAWRGPDGDYVDLNRPLIIEIESWRQLPTVVEIADWVMIEFRQLAVHIRVAGVPEILLPAQ